MFYKNFLRRTSSADKYDLLLGTDLDLKYYVKESLKVLIILTAVPTKWGL